MRSIRNGIAMMPFRLDDFTPMSLEQAKNTFFVYLTELEMELAKSVKQKIIKFVNPAKLSIVNFYESDPIELRIFAEALRHYAGDDYGRILVLWYLACSHKSDCIIDFVHCLQTIRKSIDWAHLEERQKIREIIACWQRIPRIAECHKSNSTTPNCSKPTSSAYLH